MKNIILIRHAKSSWDAPLHDKERPLNSRGVKDAHLVSMEIRNFIPKNYMIFSSTAKRAQETALIFAQNFSYPIESIVFKDKLYTFDEIQLEQVIKSFNNHIESVILFGHNEAITNFVNKFGTIFIDNVPTSGFVALQFETNNWIHINKGKTIKTVFPKELN
ncbi:histidine phosphatase family protein [Flavobacterium sp.]|uniref:SixA phosphatase family protein n=1 Tax=Flavobacterium sp. TaxID=239 RepID=UPI00286A8DBA|nr:histidine phosphatase family protein [Flavobacterium sp.]